jgi:transcriptional regulator with XRE-family HTH domain
MRNRFLFNLGGRIRNHREALSLSQVALAVQAGVHSNLVGRLERGSYNPTILKLLAIAKALKVPLSELL